MKTYRITYMDSTGSTTIYENFGGLASLMNWTLSMAADRAKGDFYVENVKELGEGRVDQVLKTLEETLDDLEDELDTVEYTLEQLRRMSESKGRTGYYKYKQDEAKTLNKTIKQLQQDIAGIKAQEA